MYHGSQGSPGRVGQRGTSGSDGTPVSPGLLVICLYSAVVVDVVVLFCFVCSSL